MEIASLTKKADFEDLAKHGRRFHSKSFKGQFLVTEWGCSLSATAESASPNSSPAPSSLPSGSLAGSISAPVGEADAETSVARKVAGDGGGEAFVVVKNIPTLKVAYAVQKRIFRNAVTRNRIKRRFRPALRAVVAEKFAGGKWFASSSVAIFLKIVPTSGILEASYAQLCSQLDLVLNQMLIRHGPSNKN